MERACDPQNTFGRQIPPTTTSMRVAYLVALACAAFASARTTLNMRGISGDHVSEIGASDLHHILSHRLGISLSVVPCSSGTTSKDAWHHLKSFDGAHYDASVLLEPKKPAHLVVMHGGDSGVLPADFRATHNVIHSGPLANSLDALARVYVKATRKGDDIADGFWQGTADIEHMIPKSLRHLNSHAAKTLRDEMASIVSLAANGGSFEAVRVNALEEFRTAYGAASAEYHDAKAAINNSLSQLAKAHPELAIVHTEGQHSSRAMPPNASGHPPADPLRVFAGKPGTGAAGSLSCPSSADELNRLTNNCSGHGTAVETLKGGQKCFRCSCKPTKGRSGTITWSGAACDKVDYSIETLLFGGIGSLLFVSVLTAAVFLYREGENMKY